MARKRIINQTDVYVKLYQIYQNVESGQTPQIPQKTDRYTSTEKYVHRKQTNIRGKNQMQESATEVHNAIQKALQAFQDMKYPVTKWQLIDKAKSLNARNEVIQAIENIPDKEYHSSSDVLQEFKGIQNVMQAFRDVKFPATRNQLVEEAKKLNARSEVINILESCSDREYTNFSDVIKECKGKGELAKPR
ncbi:hypothetical protein MSKOL_0184 [Methanosarcina sp. Kolksee]|uniref:DUF2795 domain-containing protein n=1 Tax=Methanosarcina sp. Kolksee TaxID=1434099 RepID=UPI0006161E13|nr:DUF2795 domain-containing protein [Methanosarcina sp. Kolksee]AKB45961.1 hypothetical protein MSKOL_0184 [Methanosarcina sp. Kolksee]